MLNIVHDHVHPCIQKYSQIRDFRGRDEIRHVVSIFRALLRAAVLVGNNTIFSMLYDCRAFWERDRKRVSFPFLHRQNPWRKFCSRKSVFAKLLEVDFRSDIRARCQKEGWMSMETLPIQLAPRKGYEKS